jgi:glycosyltransferase involved in cell wall biosynthesis
MKITIIQGAFFPVPPLLGGAVEKMWFRLGQEFAAIGHEVTHLSRRCVDLPEKEIISGVRHARVRGYNQPSNIIRLKALDFLYSLRACREVPLESDIVVTNTFWSPLLLPKVLRSKVYVNVERVPKGQMKWYSSAARLRGPSRAITEAIRREVVPEQYQKISYIANPFPFDPPRLSDRCAKSDQILYCGRVHPEKGIELLIDACAGLQWPVMVIGPQEAQQGGGGRAYCEGLRVRASRIGANITFRPPVFDVGELSQAYNKATIFVYPSIAEAGEAGPVAPREAMAWGCVPVVSGLDCFKDIIQHGKNGMIFDHRSANPVGELRSVLDLLIDDRSLRGSLSTEAAKICQTHSPQQIASLLLSDFQAVIDKR